MSDAAHRNRETETRRSRTNVYLKRCISWTCHIVLEATSRFFIFAITWFRKIMLSKITVSLSLVIMVVSCTPLPNMREHDQYVDLAQKPFPDQTSPAGTNQPSSVLDSSRPIETKLLLKLGSSPTCVSSELAAAAESKLAVAEEQIEFLKAAITKLELSCHKSMPPLRDDL